MEDEDYTTGRMEGIKLEDGAANGSTHYDQEDVKMTPRSDRRDDEMSPRALSHDSKSRSDTGDGTPGTQKPRLSRKSSQKNDQPPREPTLYNTLPDVTEEACKMFRVIPDCLYGSKHLGSTDNDAFDCDCREEWRKRPNLPP